MKSKNLEKLLSGQNLSKQDALLALIESISEMDKDIGARVVLSSIRGDLVYLTNEIIHAVDQMAWRSFMEGIKYINETNESFEYKVLGISEIINSAKKYGYYV